MPEREDDEDLLPELPPFGDLDDEEPLGTDEATLGEVPDEEEEVGLDDAAGVEDDVPLFALELPPKDEIIDEDDVDVIPIEGIDGDDEYGWTDDPAESEGAFDDDISLPAPFGISDDGGEEGVEDLIEGGGGDDDVPHLPPLRGALEPEEPDDLANDETYFEPPPPESISRLEPPACVVEHLGGESAIFCAAAEPALAGGEGLFSIRPTSTGTAWARIESADLDDIAIASIAARGDHIALGTRDAGVLRSADGGASFTSSGALGPDVSISLEAGEPARLWARARGGTLYRSDDHGEHWSGPLLLRPVVALATPPEGGAIALCAGRDAPPQIVRTDDGGQRWAALAAPAGAFGNTPSACFIATEGDAIAISCAADTRGPYLSLDRGRRWSRAGLSFACGPVALVEEDGSEPSLYAALVEGALVLRHAERETSVVLDTNGAKIHALVARRQGPLTELFVCTAGGLYRVTIDPERAP